MLDDKCLWKQEPESFNNIQWVVTIIMFSIWNKHRKLVTGTTQLIFTPYLLLIEAALPGSWLRSWHRGPALRLQMGWVGWGDALHWVVPTCLQAGPEKGSKCTSREVGKWDGMGGSPRILMIRLFHNAWLGLSPAGMLGDCRACASELMHLRGKGAEAFILQSLFLFGWQLLLNMCLALPGSLWVDWAYLRKPTGYARYLQCTQEKVRAKGMKTAFSRGWMHKGLLHCFYVIMKVEFTCLSLNMGIALQERDKKGRREETEKVWKRSEERGEEEGEAATLDGGSPTW